MERIYESSGYVRPDVVTFTTFIRNHCKARDMRAALSCLGAMRRAAVSPNEQTFAALINGYNHLHNHKNYPYRQYFFF
jgi:pentatricopeptide repeat protein